MRPLQRAGGRCEPVRRAVRILAPEPPPRTAQPSRDGRVIPLQVKALLEAVERPWATPGGIRVVPRKSFTPLTSLSRGRFFRPPHD